MSKSTKDMERAQAAFHKKDAQVREATKAMADYEAARGAEREKTVRLRALRLAKEAADKKAAEQAAAEKPKATGKKKRR